MTTTLKLVTAMFCVGALFAPVAMAQTKEFVAETPNLPDPKRPVAAPMVGGGGLTPIPEPGSLALVAVAAVAAGAVMRRKK